MKKQTCIFTVGGLLLFLFIVVSVFIFRYSNDRIQQGYLASEGNAAANFAVLTAQNIHLTDEQVTRLKNYSYAELMTSEENIALADMMRDPNFSTKVDYAYVLLHLKENEVKYTVTENCQDRFDAPVGTKLDIMWLLDVNVSESAEEHSMNADVNELNHYSYYIEEDATILGNTPTYIYNSSEWGDHICGYAPLYSTEGTYIGAVGVELQVTDYAEYCGTAVTVLGSLMTVTLLMLTLVFWFIYHQYKKLQVDKIYTDALTELGNRTYYNDRFIKQMNTCRKTGQLFALMILDVDLFKKVNDTFGHDIGDDVLREMGEILLTCFDKKQVVRFGGEEFVAGMWLDHEEQLRDKLDSLFALVAAHKFSKLELTISISAGCSYAPTESVNGWLLSGMLRAADCNLYKCKENGRNQYQLEQFDSKKVYTK